ncbi:MAG TPA: extracellular solute-binding protein [Candidatus Binatia bacterium]
MKIASGKHSRTGYISPFVKGGLRGILFASLMFLACVTTADAQSPDIEAAKREGSVSVYGSVVPQSMTINAGFEKKYGVRVEYWRADSTAIMERALTEWRAGKPGFDVIEGSRAPQIIMKKEGLFSAYVPPSAEKFPDQFKEKDRLMVAWRAIPISILYNTELVKAGEAPKKWDDLLDAKWRGFIGMPDPSQHATTAIFLSSLRKIMGDKWLDFVKGLARQQPRMVQALAPVTDQIIRGEVRVGITYIKYVKQYKGPLDYVLMDQHLADPNYMSVGAKAQHPNAAKLYMEYACSSEGQRAMAGEGEFVLYPGITPAIKNADKVAQTMILMDVPTGDELKKLMDDFHRIFYGT